MNHKNDMEKKILEMLSEELMSVSQLAKILHMRRDVTAGYLQALKDQGKLALSKVGKAHVYRVAREKND